jgi:deoxyribonuclease-4
MPFIEELKMFKQSTKHLIGMHLSISGGLHQAITRAEELNCSAVQFFSKNNRQWHTSSLSIDEIDRFKQALANSPTVLSTIIHASYLINIGSSDTAISQRATIALQDELSRAQQLGVDSLVFHPGSHKDSSDIECLDQIALNINHILSHVEPGKTKLLIETMAGQGTNVGYTFEQLLHIYRQIDQKNRIGFCLDTCHIFAAGYDISSSEAYEKVIAQFDSILGLQNLYVIHLNDSKKELGSRVDRHEHIGKGLLGIEAFKYIMNDSRLQHIPKILETPIDHPSDNLMNITTIRDLIDG